MKHEQILRLLWQAINAACKTYGQETAGSYLYGHSIGGMLALRLAAEHPHDQLLGLSTSDAEPVYHTGLKEPFRAMISNGSPGEMDHAARVASFLGPS